MFPYAMITASMLLNKGNPRPPKPPLIETLPNYIQMPTAQFHDLLFERSKKVGLLEMCDMAKDWYDFDNLSEKQKIRFVRETIDPEYYSIWNRFKRLIKKNN